MVDPISYQIKNSKSYMITTESDVEFRVNRDRALELQKQSTSMMAAVEILEKGYEDLEGNDDDLSKPKLVELVQEIEDYQESIKEVFVNTILVPIHANNFPSYIVKGQMLYVILIHNISNHFVVVQVFNFVRG